MAHRRFQRTPCAVTFSIMFEQEIGIGHRKSKIKR